MKLLTYLLGLILLISCNSNQKQDSIKKPNPVKPYSLGKNKSANEDYEQRWDILYVSMNNDAIVFGDSIKKKINYVAIKFEPHIRFKDFQVDSVYNGQPGSLDFESNPESKTYRTRIRETYKTEGVNFAGHYCFVEWGCGYPCQMSVIIDLESGKIYDGPSAALGYEYKKDSRMLIVNPTEHTGSDVFHPKPEFYLDCPYCKPEIYIWDDKIHKFEKR